LWESSKMMTDLWETVLQKLEIYLRVVSFVKVNTKSLQFIQHESTDDIEVLKRFLVTKWMKTFSDFYAIVRLLITTSFVSTMFYTI